MEVMKINFYDVGTIENNQLKFAVISTKHQGKWVFVKHKERSTWEIPGGHRECQEDINNTASRELFEETGAKDFKIFPICIYSVEREGVESFGQLFYAEVETFGKLPDLEIGEVKLFDEIPVNLTYPQIQPFLFERTIKFLDNYEEVNELQQDNDLRISKMLELSYRLWEKNKDAWSPMGPEYGKTFILYMIEEIGESIAIIKKKGEKNIMDNPDVRGRFIEELADVLMYYMDLLNRFDISAKELSNIYIKKFENNMNRNYKEQYENLYRDL